jgi:hypothetical protein
LFLLVSFVGDREVKKKTNCQWVFTSILQLFLLLIALSFIIKYYSQLLIIKITSVNLKVSENQSPALLLSMWWSLQKYFSHPSLIIYFFLQPRYPAHTRETETANSWVQQVQQTTWTKHYEMPLKNSEDQSGHIYYTLLKSDHIYYTLL